VAIAVGEAMGAMGIVESAGGVAEAAGETMGATGIAGAAGGVTAGGGGVGLEFD
jgi:hypothetical protein